MHHNRGVPGPTIPSPAFLRGDGRLCDFIPKLLKQRIPFRLSALMGVRWPIAAM
jgi:hypothetical protein